MPFARPPLTSLRSQVAQSIAAALPGADPLLRYSNLGILGEANAGLAHLHFGYLDWIARQAVPFTCDGEFLEAWAAMKAVFRQAAQAASGRAVFSATTGATLPAGTPVSRRDGVKYVVVADAFESGGEIEATLVAVQDPAGQSGANGNCPAGTTFALGTAVAGVNASGAASSDFTGGADIQTDDSLREQMLLAYQTRARGGSRADFVLWARSVSGVTRAWVVPNGFGAGSVVVYVMLDSVQAAFGGFPQGTNGAAAGEGRYTTATGDQLAVAEAIWPLQPVPCMTIVQAPSPHTVNFTISGISSASTATRSAIASAIRNVFRNFGEVAGAPTTVPLSLIEAAIVAVPNTLGFVVTSPTGDVVSPAGALPVLGAVTYA